MGLDNRSVLHRDILHTMQTLSLARKYAPQTGLPVASHGAGHAKHWERYVLPNNAQAVACQCECVCWAQ
jgi:hypothetical protein